MPQRDDHAFKQWLREVSVLVEARYGVGLSDLPDCNTRSAYDDGTTPAEFLRSEIVPMVQAEFEVNAVDEGDEP